jgi:hypothetical protein
MVHWIWLCAAFDVGFLVGGVITALYCMRRVRIELANRSIGINVDKTMEHS